MHLLSELTDWEKMFKVMVWKQLGEIGGRKILDFGSGQGIASIVKHNRAGRVMQMAVLLDDMEQANNLLDGKNSTASKFGSIRYYEDEDIHKWSGELKLTDTFGIRTFWDLQQNQGKHSIEDWQEKMLQLEERVSIIKEYREIAFFHHIIFTKE